MKTTFFIIVLVLKSNANMKIWHFRLSQLANSLKPAKTVYLKTRLKCLPPAFTQARSLLTKLSMALLMEFCGRSSHIVWKTFFSSWKVFGFGWNVSHTAQSNGHRYTDLVTPILCLLNVQGFILANGTSGEPQFRLFYDASCIVNRSSVMTHFVAVHCQTNFCLVVVGISERQRDACTAAIRSPTSCAKSTTVYVTVRSWRSTSSASTDTRVNKLAVCGGLV